MPRPRRVPFAFDIETAPASDRLAVVDPFDPADIKVGNMTDPIKIQAKIDTARNNYTTEINEKAALSPLTGRVIAIGYLKGVGSNCVIETAVDEADEPKLLKWFWSNVQSEILSSAGHANELVGWNSNDFDLPYLIRRSWKYKINVPELLFESWERRPYYHPRIRDAMIDFSVGVWSDRWVSLNSAAQFLGIGGKSGEVTGKNWWEYISGSKKKQNLARAYLCNDLNLTAQIHELTANDIRGYS